MVWAGSSADGLSMFQSMYEARLNPVPSASIEPYVVKLRSEMRASGTNTAGNQSRFFSMPAAGSAQRPPEPTLSGAIAERSWRQMLFG
jgi:hypothetical protein